MPADSTRETLSGPLQERGKTTPGPFFGVLLLGLVVHAGIVGRGLFALSADESGRTLEVFAWLRGTMDPETPWLPLYRVLYGAALTVFPDLFWTPRVVTMVLGLILVAGIMGLASQIFQDRRLTVLAGVLAAFYPPRAVLGAVPLSETLFGACVIPGAAFLAGWMRRDSPSALVAGCGCIALAAAVRYEGWILAAVAALTLFHGAWRGMISRRLAVISVTVVVAVPAGWILQSVLAGKPLYFFHSTVNRFVEVHGSAPGTLWRYGLPWQFLRQSLFTLNILGFVSLVRMCREDHGIRRAAGLAVAAFILTALVTMITRGMPTDVFWRIPAVWSFLLLPFTARFLLDRGRGAIAVLILIHILQIEQLTRRNTFTPDDRAIGHWIRESSTECCVALDTVGWGVLNVMIASGHPEIFHPGEPPGPDCCLRLIEDRPDPPPAPPGWKRVETRGRWALWAPVTPP